MYTKSSTEAELVAIDDAMGKILRTRPILAAQGVPVPTTTIYQDIKSTILLAENGCTSSGRHTRHLHQRQDKKGEVKIAYRPMSDMLGDFSTKPLQGRIFVNMHAKILNLPSSKGAAAHRSVLRMDKNIAINEVSRNAKWACGTEVHTQQTGNNKGKKVLLESSHDGCLTVFIRLLFTLTI